ncbi:oocyte zinc finger protein XlCOF7.1-like isoform X1 [Xenopus laevis]|uniref:Oocyte Zinc finger protein XlCOF7.1-like isoform X1 n=1 Tax=Xenopus laevis TaxID=8355 RepID=A0A8J0UMJ1_XENLA|nr:oocyte zinc finger protein XlCOF7.1-like isoform X1 [Xenopus laevis]XP_018105930.1 oocyte zinc finger protein XlCOF7.1-like isoform X1 [Xenopus laevis]
MMDRDRNRVTEKILDLTLEIICLLTGEDYIVVKKTDHEKVQPNQCLARSLTSLVQEEKKTKKNPKLTDKIPKRSTSEAPACCPNNDGSCPPAGQLELSKGNLEQYEDVAMENQESSRKSKIKSPGYISSTPERCHMSPFSQADTEANGKSVQDYQQVDKLDVLFPQQCKKEEVPTEINTGFPFTWEAKMEAFHPPFSEFSMNNKSVPQNSQEIRNTKLNPLGETLKTSISIPVKNKTLQEETHLQDLPDDLGVSFHPSTCCNEKTQDVSHPPDSAKFNQTVQMTEKLYLCSECGKCFTNNSDLVAHQRVHTEEKAYLCYECGSFFTCSSDLAKHKKIHASENSLSESEYAKCPAPVTGSYEKMQTGEKPLVCTECGKCFTCSLDLAAHQRDHVEAKNTPSSELEAPLKGTTVLPHQRIDARLKEFVCSNCGECFTMKSELVKHHRIHVEQNPFACSECGKCFTELSHLHRHQAMHSAGTPSISSEPEERRKDSPNTSKPEKSQLEEKHFVSAECGAGFSTSPEIVTHEILHIAEKEFVCAECGECFANNSDLASHAVIHAAGENPFLRPYGSSYFISYSSAGDKPYACSDCGKGFAFRSAYLRHQRIHTGEKPFVCSQCGKRFTQKTHLITHQRVHRNNYI